MARFDVNKMTEFRVTIISNGKSGTINSESGQIKLVKAYDIESQDNAVLEIIFNNPCIKLEAIFLKIKTSNRCVRRTLNVFLLTIKSSVGVQSVRDNVCLKSYPAIPKRHFN